MNRFVKMSGLTLAAWGLLACANPSSARAQYYDCGTTIVAPAPVFAYSAPAPFVAYAAPAPVVAYAPPVVSYYAPAPVVSYYAPRYVAPVRYSYYAPVVTYSAPVVVSPGYASTTYYYRGLFRPRRVFAATTYYP